jgi:hypothetical protein
MGCSCSGSDGGGSAIRRPGDMTMRPRPLWARRPGEGMDPSGWPSRGPLWAGGRSGAGEVIEFFPKYTALCGSGGGTAYTSDYVDVTRYKTVAAETLLLGLTTGAGISAQLQESSDLVNWTNIGGAMNPVAPGDLVAVTVTNPARYLRVVVTVTVADDFVTLWVMAVARER